MRNKKQIIIAAAAIIALAPLIKLKAESDYDKKQTRPEVGVRHEIIVGRLIPEMPKTYDPMSTQEKINHCPELLTGAEYAELLNEFYEAENKVRIEDAPAPAANKPVRYALTDNERDYIERVIMSESGNMEPLEGQILIAQCILNACEREDEKPFETMRRYGYAILNPEPPNSSVKAAVSAVFDDGVQITDEPILFYYNPNLADCQWHETQEFVCEVGHHRFFKLRKENV